ncbi:hypothetical protein L202_06721 [Cryptococcus amylolentus CBS 6039]|uniref:Uncharacterized protein n=1 Tax=Cryptococcus amylolentus CBS 6039 TaxID=1295533 RepID=A0A1E3HGX8_9TREE|nr:hypothetical protein L202_06721 [Cryptococcus amylolentus CBS 6039]ODN75602.1 hypothetical protein L202_06721 [Cryptococcus amylolentus CBS 6039]
MGRAPLSDAELNARGFRRLPSPDDGRVVCIACHPVPNPIGRRNMISHETTDKHKKSLSEKAVRDAELSYQARWKAHSANTANAYEIPVSYAPGHSMATRFTDSQSRTYSTNNAVTSDPLPLLAGDNPQEPAPYTDYEPVSDEALLPTTIEEHEAHVTHLWQQCEDVDIEPEIMEGFDPVEDSRHPARWNKHSRSQLPSASHNRKSEWAPWKFNMGGSTQEIILSHLNWCPGMVVSNSDGNTTTWVNKIGESFSR